MKISCVGIVHYPDGVALIRDNAKQKWRLPERELVETEDVLVCIRRCVLLQTGYATAKLRFYKVQTQARTPKQGAFIKFIFGCEIGSMPIQAPNCEVELFSPDDIIKLADRDKFNDPLLIELLSKYRTTIGHAEHRDPFPC